MRITCGLHGSNMGCLLGDMSVTWFSTRESVEILSQEVGGTSPSGNELVMRKETIT